MMLSFLVNAAKFKPDKIVNPTGYQGGEGLGNLLTNVGTVAAVAAGLLLFGYLIYGGITWLTARGSEEQVERAQNIISNAVIGLVIVVAAFFATNILASALGFENIFEINIPGPG